MEFTLFEVSTEPGDCLNNGTATTDDNDLNFFQADQNGFTVGGAQDSEATSAGQVSSGTVVVHSYDYGAYGKIKAEATIAGALGLARVDGTGEHFATVPLDEDDLVNQPKQHYRNNIADAWELQAAGNAGLAADDADTSLDNTHNGDGLTRYEEYRGVDINHDGLVSVGERLDPTRKDLFVQGVGFGGDSPEFSCGTACQEAEIRVHPFIGVVGTDDRNIDILPVYLNAIDGGHISRRGSPYGNGVRNWTFDTLGRSGVGDADAYATWYPCQVYEMAVNYYFGDRPHLDHMTWTAPAQWTGAPNGVLDPVNPERVEDTNDDGELQDNETDGATNPPLDNGDLFLDGDHPVRDGLAWYWYAGLSPMDLDNDGKVELPMQAQVPVPDSIEAEKAQVVRAVITHEMGHAVGIYGPWDGHCDDQTCAMYRWSNSWTTDGHFCADCRAMVLIHNN